MMVTLTPTKLVLNADVNRLGKVVKANVPVLGVIDPTGKLITADLAELDDASAQAWLQQVKDWKKKLFYRDMLAKLRAGASA